ncbi:nmrA-like family domain-containing protein 1 [Penicillium subrubescens]|uniref:nmrA-like family domain-containing protein 1 n=1 Tax=Penicillium subrubescens TaxID=1316194 RepID=UPI002544F837|nr:nmrA-like family domain-containing protein 1 [Penicillium subrubescens]KAJ5880258.1 nmrA-like family domain-containing protein 1 [Penicillium subrubescens]
MTSLLYLIQFNRFIRGSLTFTKAIISKLITVFGATGQQGGSVIRTILQYETLSKEFKVRGITRDTSKPEAQALLEQGIELVSADMSSKDSLLKAIQGSHTVFLVTTPAWGPVGSDSELVHGKNVADVAKETGETGGRLKHVPHFDQKAHVEGYILEIGVPAMFVLPVYFMNSYTQIPLLREGEDGVYTLAYPIGEGARFPLVDIVRDMGKFVAAALKNRSETLGTQILSAADYYTPTRILAEFEEVTGKKTRFVQVDSETYKNFMPGLMGEEKLENHLFIERSGYYGGRSLKESHDLLGKAGFKTSSWKDFLLEKTSLF